MKVVYLCDSITNGAGIERIILVKANYLVETLGYEVTIITSDNKSQESYYKISDKIKIINLEENLKNISSIFNYRKKLKKIITKLKPDIMFIPTAKEGFIIPFIENKVYKVREIHFNKKSRSIQNQKATLLKKILVYVFDKIEEIIVKKYDKLVVLTEEDRLNWEHPNIEVINNCKTLKSLKVSKLDNKVALAVGRLDYQKGFDLLIEAWKLVKNKEWRLEIYGDGPAKEELLSKIKTLGLENQIYLKGATKDIEEIFFNSSIYILSSRHEGLPLVLLEAMEYGLPIVSFECPCGPKDIVLNNYSGFLVKNGSVKELAYRIQELIDSLELRKKFGVKGKLESKKYSIEIIMEKWKFLIERSINENRSTSSNNVSR